MPSQSPPRLQPPPRLEISNDCCDAPVSPVRDGITSANSLSASSGHPDDHPHARRSPKYRPPEEPKKELRDRIKGPFLRFLIFGRWMRAYNKKTLAGDMLAGATVGFMVIPQSMAYSSLCGLNAIQGLYSSIVPLAAYSLLGSSGQLALGPTAIHCMIIADYLSDMSKFPGSKDMLQVALILSFVSGLARIGLGLLGAGSLSNFVSDSVLNGFTSAAGCTIMISQFKSLTGLSYGRGHNTRETLWNLMKALPSWNTSCLWSSLMGLSVIAFLVASKKIKKLPAWFPSQLISMIVCTGLTFAFNLQKVAGIKVVGKIDGGLPPWTFMEATSVFTMDMSPFVSPSIVLIFMAFMESVSIGKKFAAQRGYKIDTSQELLALGFANLAGSWFGAFPVTGSFSRSAVNATVGAITPLANTFTALVVLAALTFITPAFQFLPKTCLAGIIIASVYGLIDYGEIMWLWKAKMRDRWVWLCTFFVTLFFGVGPGIATGILASFTLMLKSIAAPHHCILGKVPCGDGLDWRNVKNYPDAEVDPDVMVWRFDSTLGFPNIEHFIDTLTHHVKQWGTKYAVVDGRGMNGIDSTAVHKLEALVKDMKKQGVTIVFAYLKGPVTAVLDQVYAKCGDPPFKYFRDLHSGIEYCKTDLFANSQLEALESEATATVDMPDQPVN